MANKMEENDETGDLRKILSDNIRTYRKELHLTQETLAELADISLSYLADIEHCKTWVSDKTLLKLAKALHKMPSELFIEENVETKKLDIHKISDIIYDEKKAITKSINEICDKTIQTIMKVK